MANATGPQEDFGGDEFSNNLFSDLAPLLTLFIRREHISSRVASEDGAVRIKGNTIGPSR